MAEIDDLKSAVSKLGASQDANDAALAAAIARVAARQGSSINPADVAAAATAVSGVQSRVDANTVTINSIDA